MNKTDLQGSWTKKLLIAIGLILFFLPGRSFAQNTNPIAIDDYVTMCENSGVINIPVQNNDTDPENNALTTSIYSLPQNGIATLAGNTINYTPDNNFSGNDTIIYVVCDDGSPSLCDTARVIITVNPIPIADAESDETVCLLDSASIGTPGVLGVSYLWSPSTGLSSNSVPQPNASPAVTTTYYLLVTNLVTGCENRDTTIVTINPLPIADAGPDHTACEYDSVLLGTPGIVGNTYYWSPIPPLNWNSIAQPMASPFTTTTFTLTVTTTLTGCQSKDSVIVTINPAPATDAGSGQTICNGDSVMIGSPGVVGNTYSWSPATGLSSSTVAQPMASPSTTTTYTLTVTNSSTGCGDYDQVIVTVGTSPIANAGPDQTSCNGDSVQIGSPAVVGNTYSWSPVTGLSSSTVAQPMAHPLVTTTYTLTVSNSATGCQSTDIVIVSIGIAPIANAGIDQTICSGSSVLIGTPAIVGNTYSWSPATGLSSTTVAQPTASPIITTTYTVTVTNTASGCQSTDAVVITVNPSPIANAGPDQSICNGDSVMIGTPAIVGNTYLWTPATGLSSSIIAQPMAHPIITTSYTLTVTNTATGCQKSDVVVVTVGASPIANAGTDQTICNGGSVLIGTPGIVGNTYSWSPATGLSSTTVAQPTASPIITTTYTVTVTNTASGCQSTDAVVITVNPSPIANAGPDQTSCNGDSVMIGTPAIVGNTYLWTPATGLSSSIVAQPMAHPLITTSYTLTVTNTATGCQSTDIVIVSIGVGPIANAGTDQTICNGGSVLIGTPAIVGNTYLWSPAIGLSSTTVAQPTASPIITTTYTVTVTNTASGCQSTDAVVITVNPSPIANAGPDQSICNGDSVLIGTPAIVGNTYLWTPATGLSSSIVAQPMAHPLVTTSYTLTVTNTATGCQSTDIVIVSIGVGPITNAGADQTICNGGSVLIGTPAIVGNTYLWSPATGLSSTTVAQPTASPIITTTYTVTVTNTASGCQSTDAVVITVNPSPIANAGPDQSICNSGSVVIGTPAIVGNTYSWSPATGLSSTTIAQPTASPIITTTYTVTVTNTATGCQGTDVVVVTVGASPIANAGADQTICNGGSVLIGTPAIVGNTYSWSPATGLSSTTVAQPTANPIVTTTYTVTVTNTASGCQSTDAVVITVNPSPIANAGPDQISCNGDSVLIGTPAIVGNTYSWSPVIGLSSSTVAQPMARPLITTTYTLTVTNSTTGCQRTDTVIVSIGVTPIANAGTDRTICNGDSISIGTPAIVGNTYSWSPVTGLSSSTVAQPMASPAITTTYVVTVSNSNSVCQNTDTVVVFVNPSPVANAGADQTICNGDSILIGTPAIVGNTYLWTPAIGLSSSIVAQPMASPIITTSYTLTVTNTTTGCQKSDAVVVTVGAGPVANAGADPTICNGDSTMIGTPAIVGNTYSWSPATGLSSTTVAQPTASPILTTTYIVIVTNSTSGCHNTDTVVVNVNPLPVANAGADRFSCNGDSIMIGTPAIVGNSYSWSPILGLSSSIVAQPMARPLVTTSYTLTVTNNTTGCQNTDTVIVTIGVGPIANAGVDQTICNGDSALIGTPAIVGNTYSWSPATGLSSSTVAQPTASPSINTTYVVTVSNSNSVCQTTDTVVVFVNPSPVANAGTDQISCSGDSVMIGTPAIVGNTYLWSPATGLSSSIIAQPMAHPLITTSYTLTVTNTTTGCQKSDVVVVSIGVGPVANAGTDQTICNGDSTLIGTPAIVGNTYSWSPATGLNSTTIAQPTASPIITTTYVVTVSNSTSVCQTTDTVVVFVNPLPVANAGANQVSCNGDSVIIGTPAVVGYTYSWSPANGLNATVIAQPTASPSVTTTYTLTVTNATTGCTNSDTVVVIISPLAIANAGPDKISCVGDSVSIGTVGIQGNTYTWTPVSGLSSSTIAQPNASPATTTQYILTANNANGCSTTDTVLVTVNPAPIANAGTGGTICMGDSITIGAPSVAGNSYSWSPASGLSSSTSSQPTASPSTTTTYTLTETVGSCSSTDTVTVFVNIVIADAGADQTTCTSSTTALGSPAINGYTYLWTPANGLSSSTVAQPTSSATVTTTYTLLVTDTATGCSASDEVIFTPGSTEIYNAFSPNADGTNDWWKIPMVECYSDNEVTIINRWGNEVWKGKNYNNNDVRWDGKNLNGTDVPDGTYYYIITYNNTEARGWVFVKR